MDGGNGDEIGMEMKMIIEEWKMRMKLWMKMNRKMKKNKKRWKMCFVVLIHIHSHTIVQKHKLPIHPPSALHNLTLRTSLNNIVNLSR